MARTSHMTIILVLIIHSYNNENMKHTIEAGLVTQNDLLGVIIVIIWCKHSGEY